MTQDEVAVGQGARARPQLSELFKETYLSVDVRWLGIFRILYGCLLVVDLLRRWVDLRFYYSNDGGMPNHFALFRPGWRNVFSVFYAFSSFSEVNVAFLLAFVCFVVFTLGYRTKLFHALSLLFITSLNARNLFVENGGTIVVNLLGLWTLFLPLGRRFSIDAVLASLSQRREENSTELNDRSQPPIPNAPHVSLVVLALLLQWSVIYFFNFVHKSGVGWRNHTAIYWFLEQNRIVTWFGVWARNHLSLVVLKLMTRGALLTEATLSFVLLIPFAHENMRRMGLFLALGLHGAIAAMSRLGPFSYVMIMGFVIHLSATDFAFVARWFARPSRARTVIYDADCGICLFLCRLLKRLDPFERLTFVANDEREKIPAALDDALLDRTLLVLLPDGRAVGEERAVFEVVRALPLGIVPAFWLVVPGLSAFGNALYRRIADNRARISTWFGLARCGMPGNTSPAARLGPRTPSALGAATGSRS